MSKLLQVKGLTKTPILMDINFCMDEGEMIAIMGPSGSGKSTLLYQVSGMDQADGGEVLLGDTQLLSLSEEEKAELRLTRVGYVFQNMNMLGNLNIIDNIMFPAMHMQGAKKRKEQIRQNALRLMENLGVKDLAERKITQVSGGQLQRACICRSMMNNPMILFADEPTGALHRGASREVMDAFTALNREGTSILLVTHDSKVASRCDRIIYLLDGTISGELMLGKEQPGREKERETKVNEWLGERGW